jgi:lipoprotein
MLRIKRLLTTLAVTAACIGGAHAQLAPDTAANADSTAADSDSGGFNRYTGQPAMDAFINAPARIFPALDHMTRMDMADYFNSGSPKPSKNVFKGDTRITAATPAQVTVATTDISQAEITVLPVKGDSIIMLITTLDTPSPDSSVKFYTYPGWEPVKNELFTAPGLDDWISEGDTTSRDDLENAVPFILAKAVYDPTAGTLTLENDPESYLSIEDAKVAKKALKDKLVYRWDGRRMEKEKN